MGELGAVVVDWRGAGEDGVEFGGPRYAGDGECFAVHAFVKGQIVIVVVPKSSCLSLHVITSEESVNLLLV